MTEVEQLKAQLRALEQRQAWRPEVVDFADAMERKLKANDNKGGWKMAPITYLFSRLEEELAELKRAVVKGGTLDEAADVANFAMMIADVMEGLKPAHPAVKTEAI